MVRENGMQYRPTYAIHQITNSFARSSIPFFSPVANETIFQRGNGKKTENVESNKRN